jgi:hypothetical protein
MRMASCHPDRKYLAKGLCSSCYDKQRSQSPKRKEMKRKVKRAFHARNPGAQYAYNIWHKHGLTVEQVQAMRKAQGDCCAICKAPFSKVPHIDHCHTTGQIRGLLCAWCNNGLGHLDTPGWLAAAEDYLHKTVRVPVIPPPAFERGMAA